MFSKKMLVTIVLGVMLCLSSSWAGETNWTNGAATQDWWTAGNWDAGVPSSTTTVGLNGIGAASPVISSGVAETNWIQIADAAGQPGELTIDNTGQLDAMGDWVMIATFAPGTVNVQDSGTFNLVGSLLLGYASHGILNLSDPNASIWVGSNVTIAESAGGSGELNMSGGGLTVNNQFWIGYQGFGQVNLSGGEIGVNGTFGFSTGQVDISNDGVLRLTGDRVSAFMDTGGFVDLGQVTAFGGDGVIEAVFDGDYTLVTALAYKAVVPIPADGADDVPVTTDLDWSGPTAYTEPNTVLEYDVYFGPSGSMAYQGQQSETTFVISGDLVVDTPYEWKIDTIVDIIGDANEPVVVPGDVWSFETIARGVDLVNPSPSGVTGVAVDAVLEWTADASADSYDVYIGPVGNIQFAVNQPGTTFDPDLTWSEGYEWRVDIVEGEVTYPGQVWTFSTVVPVCNITFEEGDLNDDCVVNLLDFSIIATNWLNCGWDPPAFCP